MRVAHGRGGGSPRGGRRGIVDFLAGMRMGIEMRDGVGFECVSGASV